MCLEKHEKGECFYILSNKIRYYTKEFMSLVRIASIAFLLIVAIIGIKYKVQYQVSFDHKVIGYVDAQDNIEEIVDEKLALEEDKNIAFVDWKTSPTLQVKLVSKNIENSAEKMKEEITEKNQLTVVI